MDPVTDRLETAVSTSHVTDTLARLRQTFATGKTLPIEWRLAQLGEIDRMLREHTRRTSRRPCCSTSASATSSRP